MRPTPSRAGAVSLVRAVKGYGLPTCLRITIGTEEEVVLVSEAVSAFMRTYALAALPKCLRLSASV